MTTPCCAAKRSVSTCAHHRRASMKQPTPSAWLVMPQASLIRGACVISTLEWDCVNGNQRSVLRAVRHSNPQAVAVNGARTAVTNVTENKTSAVVTSDGIARTRRRATTKPEKITTLGRVAAHRLSTKNLRSITTARFVSVAEPKRYLSITRTKTDTTHPLAISSHCAKGAIRCTTTARETCHSFNTRRHSQCSAKAEIATLNYGMKEKLLANKLRAPVEEAVEIRERYLAALPAVSRFYEEAIEECRKSGYSYTICGRRRFLPEIVSQGDSDRWKAERQAVNNQIQGTAADAAKLAMINCYNADLESAYGCRMLLQIHDELIFECPNETARMALAEIQDHMTDPFPSTLEVALTASGGAGLNWCAAKEGH